jgi:transcriptional regulator with XRE-family HTH domain
MEVTQVTLSKTRLSSVIKHRRVALGLTQQQLADRAGVTKNYVTMVERGARKGVSFLVRVLLAEALGIPAMQVLTTREAEILAMVSRSFALEGAESVVWQLQRCMESGGRLKPTVSKVGAALAIRRMINELPDRREELERLRGRLNELFR